jgi:hypothetical protein
VNVAVCPAVTVWLVGWVVIVGATAAATFATKFSPAILAPLMFALWLAGLNV